MVAHLLRLRFRLLANGLLRSPWVLISVILGALWGLMILVGVVVGMVSLSFTTPDVAWTVAVLAGSVTLLGWIVLPLVLRGLDQSLSVSKLRTFPIPPQRLVVALLFVGLLGIPGIVTLIAALSTTLTWLREPLALVAAPFAAVLAVVTCVAASRAFESVGAALAAGRRYREVMGVLVFVPLMLIGPIIAFAGSSLAAISEQLPRIAAVLSWTPLGAAWSIPGDLALDRPLDALAKLGIALATLAVLLLLWWRSLSRLLVAPPTASGGSGRSKGLGFFNVFPATPTGAVAARTSVYWMRDPRYGGSLIVLPLIAVIAVFLSSTGSTWMLVVLGPIVAATLAITLCAEVSYDGTAFAAHLSTGVSGAADRAGRVITLGILAVPLVIAATVIPLAMLDMARDIPAFLGIGLGLLLTGFGVSSVASARFLMPVPAAGESPFKTPPGTTFMAQLSMFVAWAIVFGLALPELILGIVAAATGSIVLGFVALAIGLVLGTVFMLVGIRMGGSLLERRGPELLASLRKARGA
ncbi:transporter [Salinibacterium sp. dk2585]|uniref:transporter n=1 Tax=unclassified Salinibacterium TaxID=2632331 RepID=UPI0011C248B1|nr:MULTISPECIES: transporter [unclassified Salinibacterium]QEE60229.1 transporter [Salinibacterium sp. dk2585]TXK55301.1 transporter [Salinibacterium sp. dk5596]